MKIPKYVVLSEEIQQALNSNHAIVALESTVITHGLPQPENLELAEELESIIRDNGAVPATIALLQGTVHIGLEKKQLATLASASKTMKLSSRDIASAIVKKSSGGTTVAATLRIAAMLGISVFSTGGIGGVHRGSYWDVSADLREMANQKMILVSAGAKAILDLAATIEVFESLSVPVLGYKSAAYPAFYSRESGMEVSAQINSVDDVHTFAQAHWAFGGKGIMLTVPIPKKDELARNNVEQWIQIAQLELEEKGLSGPQATPYLLKRLGEISKGKTLKSNLALLKNNARIAAKLAISFNKSQENQKIA